MDERTRLCTRRSRRNGITRRPSQSSLRGASFDRLQRTFERVVLAHAREAIAHPHEAAATGALHGFERGEDPRIAALFHALEKVVLVLASLRALELEHHT